MLLNRLVNLLISGFRKVGEWFIRTANSFASYRERSRLIQSGSGRSLYLTKDGSYFWLNETSYVDQCIKTTGIFEPCSTIAVKRLVKPGDVVLDVGANIGYYSVLLSKLVGPTGKVVCFEPTTYYSDILRKNLQQNNIANVDVCKIGLSAKKQSLSIEIGESSATLHSVGQKKLNSSEIIELTSLDRFIEESPLPKIDFIKIDVDGHEPFFFEGAWAAIDKYNPVILMEVNHLNYYEAGVAAWDFYDDIVKRGFSIYHENGFQKINSKEDFLVKCANFSVSSNIIISRKLLA